MNVIYYNNEILLIMNLKIEQLFLFQKKYKFNINLLYGNPSTGSNIKKLFSY